MRRRAAGLFPGNLTRPHAPRAAGEPTVEEAAHPGLERRVVARGVGLLARAPHPIVTTGGGDSLIKSARAWRVPGMRHERNIGMSKTDLDTILFHLKRALGNDPAAQEEVQRAVAGLEQRLRDIESRLRALERIPDPATGDSDVDV